MSIKRITTGHYFNITFCYFASVQGKSEYQTLQWDSPRLTCESRRFLGQNCFCKFNLFSVEIFKTSNLGRYKEYLFLGHHPCNIISSLSLFYGLLPGLGLRMFCCRLCFASAVSNKLILHRRWVLIVLCDHAVHARRNTSVKLESWAEW